MVLQEMKVDLPCPEAWFQASSPSVFFENYQIAPPTLLVDTVRILCTGSLATARLKGYSKLSLFTIVTSQSLFILSELRI